MLQYVCSHMLGCGMWFEGCDSCAGAWHIFTGNEIGILLAHWLWCCWRRDHMDDDPACVVMLASAVSSRMLQAMAQVTSTSPRLA